MNESRVCSVDGCDKKYLCRGYCSMHYEREFRQEKRRKPGSRRFARHGAGLAFLRAAIASDTNECIIWPYGKDRDGYAIAHINGVSVRAQRYVCTEVYGPPLQTNLESCHSCRPKACLNWRHLRWDTTKSNAEDRLKDDTNQYGQRNHNNKLTPEQVLEIRAAYPSLKLLPLAKRYGVSVHTVHCIVRRKVWKHI